MARSHRLVALTLIGGLLAAGCGLGTPRTPSPVALGSLATLAAGQGHVGEDEADLSAGVRRMAISPAMLKRESVRTIGTTLFFPTRQTAPGRLRVGPTEGVVVRGTLNYPDRAGVLVPAENVTVHLEIKGTKVAALTDAQGNWEVALAGELVGKPLTATYELGNRLWTINQYRWEGPVVAALQPINDTGTRTLDAASQNGKAALIHQVWNRALGAFKREGIPVYPWWSRQIDTTWPASGNFYSGGSVNLTDAEWWDVNGHEIGHAMFFAAFNSSSGGGPHKIDECYGAELAWSEGFASFFSAVIAIDRADPDAKFEFMVPRRKPIRMENVPADVCLGHTNEWRVGSALWDLYDTNEDGQDHAALTFKAIWGALAKTTNPAHMNDVRDGFKRIAASVPAAERPGLIAAFAQSGIPVSTPGF